MFWPIVVLANLSLLSIATAGIYWIGSNAAIVEDHSETKIQPTSVATPSVPKSTEPVSEDFESEELSKSPRTFESPIGKWQLPASCEFWNKDEGQRHLHLIADEPIEIEVDSTIAFPAKCLMNIEMRFRQDSPNPNTIMQLSISANGKDWLPIEANESNPSVKTRRNLKPVPSKIQFVIREPATSHIRIKYTGKGDPNQKSKSGILIGNFDLKPIDPDEPEEPKF